MPVSKRRVKYGNSENPVSVPRITKLTQTSYLSNRGLKILRDGLRNPSAEFHEHQWEAIQALVEDRKRLLVVQRTGWGKSAVYFIATRLFRESGAGPTIIISPLLALMRNQIESAEVFGVKLGSINSSQDASENNEAANALLAGRLDAVIISPERLANPQFVEEVLRPVAESVGMLVIDEAHCISDWGHDFRPDYKRIKSILQFLPDNVPVLATTATANQRVMDDVKDQLGGNPEVIQGQLTRQSLHLQVVSFERRTQRLSWLAETLPMLPGTGIIYVSTVRDAAMVARWLQSRGINVESYSGSIRGLNSAQNRDERLRRERLLLDNDVKALVATTALGMGYDKPDLAFVIHFQSPGSVVGYYQQVGRAGRAIPKAYGVLMSGSEDADIQEFFIRNAFPRPELVEQILEAIEESEDGLNRTQIERAVNGAPKKIESAIKFLSAESPSPIVREGSVYRRTVRHYVLPQDVIKRVTDLKRREWQRMKEYLGTEICLMQFLARELDDFETPPCGKCSVCLGQPVLPLDYSSETAQAAVEFLKHTEIPIYPRKLAGSSSDIDARFPVYQLPPRFGELQHEEGRALCYWGEAGWGEIAMKGKQDGIFHPGLISAASGMIQTRWKPNPAPTWVTYVPSSTHPNLVLRFAQSVAQELGLPFHHALHQVKDNQPQKKMENAFHRCQNLDGVFEVQKPLPDGPALLVDDAVDSGWTFAVLAAILRREGAGPVFPFALMNTGSSG